MPSPGPLRPVALATLLAFGCATTREPLPPPPPAPPVIRVAVAEPEIELWMEGSGEVDPAESAKALAETRAAMAKALAGRGVAADEAEALLVVKERAVARTGGRKATQALAVAGMVVGIVLVVAVLAVSTLSGKGGGPKPGGAAPKTAGAAPKASGRGPAKAPAGAPVAPAPASSAGAHPALPAPPPSAPAPAAGSHPAVPASPPSVARRLLVPPPPGVNVQVGVGLEIPLPAPPEPPPPYVPPPPPTMPVEERGFFDGDEVVIDLYLQDARSGDTLWSASARDWADPRDAAAVTRLLEQALAGHAWARRAARP